MTSLPYYPSHPDIPVGDQPGSTPWYVAVIAAALVVLLVVPLATFRVEATVPDNCVYRFGACLQVNRLAARAYDDPHACDSAFARICLAPVGSTQKRTIEALVERVERQTGEEVGVLPPIAVPASAFDFQRGQFNADLLEEAVRQEYPDLLLAPGSLLVAITPVEIYAPERPQWNYAFGQQHKQADGTTLAVISTAIMSLGEQIGWSFDGPFGLHSGHEGFADRTYDRAGKLLLKYVGIAYYGLPTSSDPASVLYNNILSVRDLDGMGDQLPPR